MRVMGISASGMRQYGVSDNTYLRYQSVRNVMTRTDRPASARRVVHGGAQIPAFSFDPIMKEAICACGQEWTKMFFVPGTSWVDIDDDKVPNCSQKWKEYGMRTVPTKDNN